MQNSSLNSSQREWIKKSRILTQALMFSGALNIGLLTSFFFLSAREKKEAVAFDLQPARTCVSLGNVELLSQFSLMSYEALIDFLGDRELVENGYRKRDLALASLVSFHFFDIHKALRGIPIQSRSLYLKIEGKPEQMEISLYPGLTEDQFQGVIQFIRREKFPFTSEGLFWELQHAPHPKDPSLLEAFYLTPECSAVLTLFRRSGFQLPQERIVDLLTQGEWEHLQRFEREQRLAHDLSSGRLKSFLIHYIEQRSLLAAQLLLEWDEEYVLKVFDDPHLKMFIDLFPLSYPPLGSLLKKMLVSPRSDLMRQQALDRLPPETISSVEPTKTASQEKGSFTEMQKMHQVQLGENLWKISRRYHLSVEELKRVNRLTTDRIRVGEKLIVMQKEE